MDLMDPQPSSDDTKDAIHATLFMLKKEHLEFPCMNLPWSKD